MFSLDLTTNFELFFNILLVTVGDLVRRGTFEDLKHYKLLFSVGGGSQSTRPGALFTTLKVSIFRTIFRFSMGP